MSQKKKLIAIDMDNTLFTPDMYETFNNLSALHTAVENGITVCACTGRPWYNASHFFRLFPFGEYCITSNGAGIVKTADGTPVEVSNMDPERLPELLDYLTSMEELTDSVKVSTNSNFALWDPTQSEAVVEKKGDWLFGEYPGFTIAYREKQDWINAVRYDTQRLLLSFERVDADLLKRVSEKLNAVMPVEATISFKTMIEVMAPGCTKGITLSRLAAMMGVERENVMAIGDNVNDISMIEWAGTGVCVHNGQQALKDAADLILPDYKNGGLRKAVEYLLEV